MTAASPTTVRNRPQAAIWLALSLLLAFAFISCASPTEHVGPVEITVDASNEVYPFSPDIRGFAMNNWNWLWGGIQEPDSPRRLAMIEAAKLLKPGVIRFAGGLWVNRIGWDRAGIAPEDGTWTYTDPQTGDQFEYGHAYRPSLIDSYATFASEIGAGTVMQVNICDNNPAMWADLVHYTNIEHDYNFQFWELGNEIDITECVSRDEYAQRFVEYSSALKLVDPSIKLLGPSIAFQHRTDWYDALPPQANGGPDVLSFHWYQLTRWNSDPKAYSYQGGSLEALFSHQLAVGESCQSGFRCPGDLIPLNKLEPLANRRAIAESMKQEVFEPSRSESPGQLMALTEMGVHSSRHDEPINGNHTAALWLADMLGRWAYNGLDILTYFSFEDGTDDVGQSRGLIGMDGKNVLDVRPTFITEWLYASHFGDTMIESTTNYYDQQVVAWASTDSDEPDTLKLILVNMTGRAENVNLHIAGFTPGSGDAWVMTSDDPLSQANPDSFTGNNTKVNGVTITDVQIANPAAFTELLGSIEPVEIAASADFQYSIEPYSVAALTLRK
jgi:hypothetical protein